MQSRIETRLNDLIEISRDGKAFYEEASDRIESSELSDLFMGIAGVKGELVEEISRIVSRSGGRPAERGTLVGAMHQCYGKMLAAFGETQYQYLKELEKSEERLVQTFNEVLNDPELSQDVKREVARMIPKVSECHSVMLNRLQSMHRH
jgi:conserved hypothetical protein